MYPGLKNGWNDHYRELITEVCKATFDGALPERVVKIPSEVCVEGKMTNLCATVEQDRSMDKLRLRTILGFGLEDETGDQIDLQDLATKAIQRKTKEYVPLVAVGKEACHKCNQTKYYVTDSCEGCIARPCILNCPKKCISRVDGKAKIDPDQCIMCGKCAEVCPYTAIHKKRIPCQDVCPVGAISKDAVGNSVIDFNKCIHCGKCMMKCPFGAILMPSQVVDVCRDIRAGKRVTAMIAPAILAQFGGTPQQLHQALLKLGFHEMIEVAAGADVTSLMEAEEFLAHVGLAKQPLMTTSCCPAFYQAVYKHAPKLIPYISGSGSPMHYTAELVKHRDPTTITVFIGPCVAKRAEGLRKKNVDYVLTAEELLCMFQSRGLEVAKMPADDPAQTRAASKQGTTYAVTEGVAHAVLAAVPAAIARLVKHEGRHVDEMVGPQTQLDTAVMDMCFMKEDPKLHPHGTSVMSPTPGDPAKIPTWAAPHTAPHHLEKVPTAEELAAIPVKPHYIAPLDKKQMGLLKAWGEKPHTAPGNLIECMVCDGGCVGGPGNIVNGAMGKGRLTVAIKPRPEFKDIEDVLCL